MDSPIGSLEWEQTYFTELAQKDPTGVHNSLTDTFLSTYVRDTPTSSAEAMQRLRSEGSRQVCQYQFRKNDIVWICKQCQRDETCVLCNDCFPFSSHEGHEVFFYHSQAGGCCDCGDPGAWDPSGFCHRHGRVTENPTTDLPEGILTTGRRVLEAIAVFIEHYAVSHAAMFDIETFLVTSQPRTDPDTNQSRLFDVVLRADDIHTREEFESMLVTAGFSLTPSQRSLQIQEIMNGGSVSLMTGSYSVVAECLQNIQSAPGGSGFTIMVRRTDSGDTWQEKLVLQCISWLCKVAEVSDGTCALICSTFPPERLRRLMIADCYLPEEVAKSFHELLLMLMADISFKKIIASAYAMALPDVALKYGDGIGKSDLSIFRVSVQFLNRYVFVSDIVQNYGFLENLADSLLTMMNAAHHAGLSGGSSAQSASAISLKHHVVKSRRYDAILGDMKIIFILPTIPKVFCMRCLDTLLSAVETMQYIDPQTRQLSWHVEYENDTWIGAFNIHLSFASLFDGLIGWFGAESGKAKASITTDAEISDLENNPSLHSFRVSDMLTGILRAIYSWHQSKAISIHRDEEVMMPSTSSTDVLASFNKPLSEFSFHILFHRFFASCIKECCRFPQHEKTLSDFAQFLCSSSSPADLSQSMDQDMINKGVRFAEAPTDHGLWWFYALADYPMSCLVTASQIKLKMWTRNGVCMLDQLLNYSEFPFCRIFRDLDILLIQYCGTILGSRLFLQHTFNRFNVHSLLANKRFDLSHADPPKSRQLLDEAFRNIIIIVTELPLPPMIDNEKRRGCSMDVDAGAEDNRKHSGHDTPEGNSGGSEIDDRARCRVILRREVLHRLMAGSCNYSQLYECRSFLPGQDKSCDDIIDNIVGEVGDIKKSGGMEETTKIYLKSEFWDDYDPCFYHVSLSQHQNILESKPRVKEPAPICPAPPEAHSCFLKLRHTVLTDPLLLGYVRDLLYSFVALRFEREMDKKHDHTPVGIGAQTQPAADAMTIDDDAISSQLTAEQNAVRKRAYLSVLAVTKPWVLQCTDATYLNCTQILTLLIHHLEYLMSKPVTADVSKDIDALSDFVSYCPHTLVSPPMSAFLDSASEDPNLSALSVTSLIQQQLSALSSPGMSGANTGMNSIYASAVNSNTNSANNSRRPSMDGLESIISGTSTVFDYNQPANITGINVNFAPLHGNTLSGLVADKFMCPGIAEDEEYSSEVALPLPSLLGVMLMAHDMLQSEDDVESKSYMRWCLDKLRLLLPACDKTIVDWMKAQLDNERDVYMKAKRAEAKEKITVEMKKLADQFMSSPEYLKMARGASARSKSNAGTMEIDDEDEGIILSGKKRPDGGELSVEDDECIVCRGNNEKGGGMAYLVHTHMMKERSYSKKENNTGTVHNGGVIASGPSSAPPLLDIMRDSSAMDPPVSDCVGRDMGSFECPSHLHFRFCGHAMHQSCFDAFYPQVISRSAAQHGLLIDTDIGEFQCPLCKMLNNAIVPIVDAACVDTVVYQKMMDTSRHKMAKMDVASDLEGVDTPLRDRSQSVEWVMSNHPRGLLYDYSHPSSLCMSVEVVVPLQRSPLHCAVSAPPSQTVGGSWISRAMASFPMKLFDLNRAAGSNSEDTTLSREFEKYIEEKGVQFVLPRPDDVALILDEAVKARQHDWARFLSDITSAQDKAIPGQMRDSRVLCSIANTIKGCAVTIGIEAIESSPGCHLINKDTMGMDQLKTIRGVVDVLGASLNDYHISKGIHQALISAIVGEPINALWMADNSIPVSEKYRSAALDCVESAIDLAKKDSLSSEPLVLTTRRAIQLHATCLSGSQSGEDAHAASDVFIQPLLARPLLDTLLLAVMLYRTSVPSVPEEKTTTIHQSCSADDLASALTARYYERNPTEPEAKIGGASEAAETEDNSIDNSDRESTLMVTCKWILAARLSQLVALSVTKAALRQCWTRDVGKTPSGDQPIGGELPLTDLVSKMYHETDMFITGGSCGPASRVEVNSIILEWLQFVRNATHLLLRGHFDSRSEHVSNDISYIHVFNFHHSNSVNTSSDFLQPLQHPMSDDPLALQADTVVNHLAAVDLLELLQTEDMAPCDYKSDGTDFLLSDSLLRMNIKWLRALVGSTDAPVTAPGVSRDVCGTSELFAELTQHIFEDTLCDSLMPYRAGSSSNIRSTFVTTGFLGYTRPDWDRNRFVPCTSWSSDIMKRNAAALSCRLGLYTQPASATRKDSTVQQLMPLHQRKLYEFPDSYTMFHQQIRSMCEHEYPAVCLCCGRILNAGGKAECTQHVPFCSGDAGAFFLLQDCQVVFIYHSRASYFPAPFIDNHGEKHRQFRGRPLHLDRRRYEILRSLIATGGIANEVVQKRSTSQRVIISNHY